MNPLPDANSIPARRLAAQKIARSDGGDAAKLVAWMGAVQAQDYAGVKWALGLRLPAETTEADIEAALDQGLILRTHTLRWTWQLVTPADIRWMTALVAPRLRARAAARHRTLGLDEATFRKSGLVITKALRDGEHLTRVELAARLARANVLTTGERLAHLLGRAELDGLIASGVRRGKQQTYALLDLRAPSPPTPLSHDEALAALAIRYFRSHGPATFADFLWWSSLAPVDARRAVETAAPELHTEQIDGVAHWYTGPAPRGRRSPTASRAHLLPAFDEYLVAYRDRRAVLDPRFRKNHNAGGGMLAPCLIVDGRVIGTWRRELTATSVVITLDAFDAKTKPAHGLPRDLKEEINEAARRYGDFLGREPKLAIR